MLVNSYRFTKQTETTDCYDHPYNQIWIWFKMVIKPTRGKSIHCSTEKKSNQSNELESDIAKEQ